MEIKKILLAGFIGIMSVSYAQAQTLNTDSLASDTTEIYIDDKNDRDTAEDRTDANADENSNYGRDAGIQLKSEKEAKKLDKQYEKSSRQQAKMTRAEERDAKKLQRANRRADKQANKTAKAEIKASKAQRKAEKAQRKVEKQNSKLDEATDKVEDTQNDGN